MKIQKELNDKLKNALKILRKTLIENQLRLKETVAIINNSEVQFEIQFDSSVWDVVKNDVVNNLHDSDLKKRIAYHFSRLSTMIKLNSMYLELTTGVSSALTNSPNLRTVLKNHLASTANFLDNDITELLPLIDNNLN